jgi:ABC-type transport system involved in cytochrome c biogenesis ATPase subunit
LGIGELQLISSFQAALRLQNKSKEKRSIIKKLLSDLSLEGEGNTLIKNLSGGQRRRLSLAGEVKGIPIVWVLLFKNGLAADQRPFDVVLRRTHDGSGQLQRAGGFAKTTHNSVLRENSSGLNTPTVVAIISLFQ